ncbi:hypothetical protein J1N35_009084 [Gossypium stocksii]|uniref:Uncharacterized protein n=1 Tax=Gossypium stocksii TaxID=47602 RepID=A0A9D3WAC9_9ROSI|nr:hypothetical protein J1N35_009084 [Gossypium stocksii]
MEAKHIVLSSRSKPILSKIRSQYSSNLAGNWFLNNSFSRPDWSVGSRTGWDIDLNKAITPVDSETGVDWLNQAKTS